MNNHECLENLDRKFLVSSVRLMRGICKPLLDLKADKSHLSSRSVQTVLKHSWDDESYIVNQNVS
jgi:hypothetical protein